MSPGSEWINSKGRISSHGDGIGSSLQRHLLEEEGVVFSLSGRIDLKCFGWLGGRFHRQTAGWIAMIREIQAKTMLSHRKEPDSWFGVKYNMNIYRGCQHQCIYCDSRSECYQIEDFNDVLVKVNAIPLLRKELASKRVKGTIGFGSMSDPYTPIERKYKLTPPGAGK